MAAASMGFERISHAAVRLLDGRVLVAGGALARNPSARNVELYDPAADRFEVVGDLPEGMGGTGMQAELLDDGRVLILSSDRAAIFDPSAGTITIVDASTGLALDGFDAADLHWPQVPTALADGTILITGDCCTDEGFPSTVAAIYDPAGNSLTAIGPMTEARSLHQATRLADGRVLITGGTFEASQSDFRATATAEVFDPASGTFTALEPMAADRRRHTSTLLPDGSVLLMGNFFFDPDLPAAERFVP